MIPLWQEITILLLKIERLTNGAAQANQAGDKITATRLTAEASEAAKEAIAFAERARAQ